MLVWDILLNPLPSLKTYTPILYEKYGQTPLPAVLYNRNYLRFLSAAEPQYTNGKIPKKRYDVC